MLEGQTRWDQEGVLFYKAQGRPVCESDIHTKHKGNELGSNLGKEYFRERAE